MQKKTSKQPLSGKLTRLFYGLFCNGPMPLLDMMNHILPTEEGAEPSLQARPRGNIWGPAPKPLKYDKSYFSDAGKQTA